MCRLSNALVKAGSQALVRSKPGALIKYGAQRLGVGSVKVLAEARKVSNLEKIHNVVQAGKSGLAYGCKTTYPVKFFVPPPKLAEPLTKIALYVQYGGVFFGAAAGTSIPVVIVCSGLAGKVAYDLNSHGLLF